MRTDADADDDADADVQLDAACVVIHKTEILIQSVPTKNVFNTPQKNINREHIKIDSNDIAMQWIKSLGYK